MTGYTRRSFIKTGSTALIGMTNPALSESLSSSQSSTEPGRARQVNFWIDGVMPTPEEYATTLKSLTENHSDLKDRYGVGGSVERLEQQFEAITGKQRALYLPTGTMANQLAIHVLSGDGPGPISPEAAAKQLRAVALPETADSSPGS